MKKELFLFLFYEWKRNLMKSSGFPMVTQLGRDTVRILTVAYGVSAKVIWGAKSDIVGEE